MMKNCAILLSLCVLLHIAYAANDELTLEIESDELMKTGDLEQAETKDASATEIIKQIRKLNPDGTFTIGFEANDGSFKIETRDLQGNVKQGTYGFVDEKGEVKRVSYSLQNNTLLKEYQQTTESTQSSPSSSSSAEKEDENETISLAQSSRYNRTGSFASTTRRPAALAYLSHGSTSKSQQKDPSVVQAIPKRRLLNSLDKDRSGVPFEGTTTLVYATSVPTPKPYLSRSTTSPTYSSKKQEKGVEIDQVERKVYIATAQKESATTTKPISSKINEKSDEKFESVKRGNALRRQLKADLEENIEAQQQVLYGDGDQSSAVYGSSYGNVRPLFTTQNPKIPFQVLAARQRATQLQNILANSSPGTTSLPTTALTTDKVYTKAPKRQNKIKLEDVQSDVASENYLGAQQEQFPGIAPQFSQLAENDERKAFQRPLPPHLEGLFRPRNYLRQLQQQQQPQQSIPSGAELQDIRQGRQGPQDNQRFFNQQQLPQNLQQLQQQLSPQQYYPEQQQSSDFYGGGSFLPQQRNQYGNDYDRPLTIRDFERILQVLVHRQQSPQFRVNPFYPPSNPLGYPPFVPSYNSQNPYSQIPRPPFFNNPLSSGFYDPGYQNPYYSPSMPVSQQADAMQDQLQDNPQQQQRLPQQRRRQYNSRFLTQQQTQLASPPVAPSEQEFSYNSLQGPTDNFLPPSVREQLLYRMLMLALRSDSQQLPQQQHVQPLMPSASSMHSVLEPEQQETKTLILKSTSERTSVSKKPVRSVQIIGEEAEDEEEE